MSNTSLVSIQAISSNKVPATTSLKIAEVFGKDHKHILDSISELIQSAEFSADLNYIESSYKDVKNRKQKMFILDETLTTVLLMGFTGKDAIKWKVAYAKEFQRLRDGEMNYKKSHNIFIDHFKTARSIGSNIHDARVFANNETIRMTGEDILSKMGIEVKKNDISELSNRFIKEVKNRFDRYHVGNGMVKLNTSTIRHLHFLKPLPVNKRRFDYVSPLDTVISDLINNGVIELFDAKYSIYKIL